MPKVTPNRIREFREKAGLTQKELGKLVDLDESTVARHEKGSREMSPEHVGRYAEVFKVEFGVLFQVKK